ncbi:SDR family oxidoreductase [Actinomadura rupiterrae]|uniref:SDR family oxidoreductase n=1 Tax=Actinomadura rupiterrae TaxID=559627 RepID=UPI0020A3BC00|nr:SDR family oxidoreductase [Actinomadura rupiterrae]MCP2337439.1 3-oxoacyl-[acyl-carrier protein] reductase [Actinomadura rupiterrae]
MTAPAGRLLGRTALVTGATRGIGKAIALRLGRDGADVVVNYRASSEGAAGQAADIADEITRTGGRAVPAPGDVGRSADVAGLFDAAESAFGGLDILVNNAAMFAAAPIEYLPEDVFDALVTTNLKSVYLTGQQAAARLRDGGRVINVSAGIPSGGVAFMGVYGATKAGVELLTRSLAHQLGGRRITVNAIAPGPTDTAMLADEARAMADQIIGSTPLGRLGLPTDLADVAALLASEDARWITGQVIAANGGFE